MQNRNDIDKPLENQEEKDRLFLEAQRLSVKAEEQKKAADEEYQQKQIVNVQWWGSLIKTLTFRAGSLIKNTLIVAGHAIALLAQVIPPINALFTGIFWMVDMAEALFISKETRSTRAIKATTATISTGLVVASAVMLLNPVTMPLTSIFATSAMLVNTIREGFFWYQADKALDQKKEKLETAKENYEMAREEYESGHLSQEEMNNRIETYNSESVEVSKQEAVCSEKKRNFLYSALSFAGMALITLAAVAVAGFLLANPITLGAIGVAALGVATVLAIKNRVAPPKPEAVDLVPMIAMEKPDVTNTIGEGESHKNTLDFDKGNEKAIVCGLTGNRKDATQMLQSKIADMHQPESPTYLSSSQSSSPVASPRSIGSLKSVSLDDDKQEEDDDESEGLKRKK